MSSGCSKIIRDIYREPDVRVVSLTFKEASYLTSPSTIPLTVTLEVKNPNSFAIKAKYLTYTVQAREKTIAAGEKSEITEVQSEGTALIDIPLTISLDPLLRTLAEAAEKLDISLTAFGSVTLESFLGDVKIPFKKEFKKNLRKLIFPF